MTKNVNTVRTCTVPLDDISHFASNRSLREKEMLIRKLEQYRGGQDDDGAGHDHDGDAEEATCESLNEWKIFKNPVLKWSKSCQQMRELMSSM